MIHIANLKKLTIEWKDCIFEKQSVKTNLATIIVSVAASTLICTAVAVSTSLPFGLTISLGAATGAIISITIVALHRFHPNKTENKDQSQLDVLSKAFSHPDISFKIASCLDFNGIKSFSEASQGGKKLVSTIKEQRKKAVSEIAFGKEQWLEFFGLDIGVEPILPRDIIDILNRPCPADPTKKVRDTHMLTLIPKDQSPKSLGELLKTRLASNFYGDVEKSTLEELDTQNNKSYWALMAKDVVGGLDLINGTRKKSRAEQNDILADLPKEGKVYYSLPTTLEAVASILAHEARFGERLFNDNPMTYTRCQDMVDREHNVIVGNFNTSGLDVFVDTKSSHVGASFVWRFRPTEELGTGSWLLGKLKRT